MRSSNGLRTLALFEAAKGVLVLLCGCGVFALIHRDAQHAAEHLVRHFHLNPASRYPRIFLHLAAQTTSSQLWLLAAGAAGYALVRLIEAWGLWRARPWAEWLAVVSSGLYLPIELVRLIRHVTWLHFALLAANLAIVIYLAWTLAADARSSPLGSNSARSR